MVLEILPSGQKKEKITSLVVGDSDSLWNGKFLSEATEMKEASNMFLIFVTIFTVDLI